MSNLLYNGTFDAPNITTNSYIYVSSLTAQQKTILGWTFSPTTYTSLQNGLTVFNYNNPSSIGLSQFISLQYMSNISQSLVANTGNYILSFKYTNRPGYSFNNASIILDGIVIGTVPTSSSNTWLTYSLIFNIISTGTHTLTIQGTSSGDRGIAITDVVLKSTNNLRDTNIFGYLTVNTLNQNGIVKSKGYISTPSVILDGIDIKTSLSVGLINCSYSSLPERNSKTNIGYQYINTPSTNITLGSSNYLAPTTIVSISGIDIGVYYITYTAVCINSTGTGFAGFSITLNGTNANSNRLWGHFFVTYNSSSVSRTASSSFTYNITTNNSTVNLVGWYYPSPTVIQSSQTSLQLIRIA